MKPETRARISTVSNGVKRPVYSSHSVMLFCSGCATVTAGGGGELAAGLPSQPASAGARSSRATKGTMRFMGFISPAHCDPELPKSHAARRPPALPHQPRQQHV